MSSVGLLVADLMTTPFISVRPRMRTTDAAGRMRRHHVRTAPVLTAEGQLVGVLSESDLARARAAAPDQEGRTRDRGCALVADVMRPFVVAVRPTAEIVEAEAVMLRHGLRWLAVVDTRGHLVGVLSRSAIEQAGVIEQTAADQAGELRGAGR